MYNWSMIKLHVEIVGSANKMAYAQAYTLGTNVIKGTCSMLIVTYRGEFDNNYS